MSGSYDAVVVGAGVIGLACAREAARRGLSVAVLERESAGCGASGVAAGMLAPVTEADFGEDRLLRMNLAARELWPAFASELGLGSALREDGALVVAADRDDVEELRRLHGLQQQLGLGAQWLGPSALRRVEPRLSPRVAGGIDAPGEASVEPALVVDALAEALRAEGGELREGEPVEGLVREAGRVSGVRLASGEEVRGRAVVLAGGGWREAAIRPVDVTCTLPERDLARYARRIGPVGERLATLDGAARAEVEKRVDAAFLPWVHNGEARFNAACWMVTARA